MSKKYSKWLVGAALLGAAAGAGLAYFKKHKKEKENWEDDFEDFEDDFEDFEDDFLDDDLEDFDGEDAADAREYVTIPSSSVPEEAAANAADTAEAIFEKEAEEETVKAEAEEPKETSEAVSEHAEAESKPEDADEEETVPEEAEEMVADADEEKSEEETPEA